MAHATQPTQMKAKVGMAGPPYAEYWTDTVDLTTHPQTFVGAFTMESADDATAEFAFHMGGELAGETAGAASPSASTTSTSTIRSSRVARGRRRRAPVPNVLVNQVGYLPALPKIAIVKSASKTPLKWELLKKGGAVVASGDDHAGRLDAASGETCTSPTSRPSTTPGKGYTLRVGDDVSHPFDIGPTSTRS